MMGVRFLGVFVFLVLVGCVNITGMGGQQLNIVELPEGGLAIEQVLASGESSSMLQAMVKGSIYESGETVSVFATCLDGDDRPVNSTVAFLSAWYPNGTLLFTNVSMTEIQTSYFIYTGAMNSVKGTYLTEARCAINGSAPVIEAFAFGEWQNPYWVAKINDTLANVQNITIQIGDLQANITSGFEITWDKIESVNATVVQYGDNLTTLIIEVGQIANNSVDRNDSLIVQLLLQLNQTLIFGPGGNQSGQPVNWTEDADDVFFWSNWDIRVDTFDPAFGDRLSYPDVLCTIQTTINGGIPVPMTPQGNHFIYEEFINSLGNFNWIVACQFA